MEASIAIHKALGSLEHIAGDLDVLADPVDCIHGLARELQATGPRVKLKPHVNTGVPDTRRYGNIRKD